MQSLINIQSKLPKVGTTIFTVMSALANETGAVNLSQGFPDFACSEKLVDLVSNYMKKGMNQYAPMAGVPALREEIAIKTEMIYGMKVNPDTEITITSGATEAIFSAISAVSKPASSRAHFKMSGFIFTSIRVIDCKLKNLIGLLDRHWNQRFEQLEYKGAL